MSLEKENYLLQSAGRALHRLDARRGHDGKLPVVKVVSARSPSGVLVVDVR